MVLVYHHAVIKTRLPNGNLFVTVTDIKKKKSQMAD